MTATAEATVHVHAWAPIEGQRAHYRCACGATGYRGGDGAIRAHRSRRVLAVTLTVRPLLPYGGQVPPLPVEPDPRRWR